MQLSPRAFYNLTWGQYNCRVRGWLRRDENRWEHTRKLYELLYNVHAKDSKTKEQLIPLRKDRRRAPLLPATAIPFDREALIARIKQRDNLQ